MDVGLDELLIREVEARRRHRTGDHRRRLPEVMPVVGVAVAGEGKHQRRPPAAARAAAPLGAIGGVGRDVAQVHDRELADVDPELHRRGAAQDRELAPPELRLAPHAVLGRHLAGVLAREHAGEGRGTVAV